MAMVRGSNGQVYRIPVHMLMRLMNQGGNDSESGEEE